jgi:hypothetical protein
MVCLLLISFLSTDLLIQQHFVASDKAEDDRRPAEIEKLVQAILASKHPKESGSEIGTAKAYRELFKKVGAEGLRELQTHSEDGISIQAAWEEVVLKVPEKKSVHLDRHKLDWFLGFLEGRARLRAPSWWSDSLLDSEAYRPNLVYVRPGMPKENPYHELGLDHFRGPHNTSLKREHEKIVLRVGKEAVPIPEDLLVKENVSALMKPSHCYIAVHENVGHGYKLACIDRTSEKLVWKTDVFGTWWGDFSTGPAQMWVSVTEQKERIVVFGAAATGLHVEAFRAKDGKNLFRFSTSY